MAVCFAQSPEGGSLSNRDTQKQSPGHPGQESREKVFVDVQLSFIANQGPPETQVRDKIGRDCDWLGPALGSEIGSESFGFVLFGFVAIAELWAPIRFEVEDFKQGPRNVQL